MTERPSPSQSATKFSVGTQKKGNDSNLWEVKLTKNGVHRWVKKKSMTKAMTKVTTKAMTKATKAKTKAMTKATTKTTTKAKAKATDQKNKTKKLIRLVFLEPATFYDVLYTDWKKKNIDVNFYVTPKFFQILQKAPKKRQCGLGNAYIFGKIYPKETYKFIGFHGNDVAQTGIIEYDKWGQYLGDQSVDFRYEYWEKAYPDYKWDLRTGLTKIQKINPGVVWVGETYGGDVGANLWGHTDKTGVIDSLIVDINCFFRAD